MILKKIIPFLSAVFITSCIGDDMFQDPDIVQGSWHSETMHSNIIPADFTIYIYKPEDYPRKDYAYPVLYSFDGDEKFDEVAEIVSLKIAKGEMPDVLIVGMGYGDDENKRIRDYTPTYVSDQSESGGVESFYQFIKTELIPYIDKNYQTSNIRDDRYIRGHSFGGIAALYGLFFHNDVFKNFIATSASLWYDDLIFFEYEKNYYETNTDLNVKLYASMGSQEPVGMPVMFLEFVEKLKSRNYANLKIKSEIIEGKRHWNNQDIAFAGALEWLF
ncbi:MAG: alpha/beta hydrolase-fold protein [Spirochaetia bacterium]|nr:alpha/beta hydrolase-fold protein [Spirochaetia bacterium]